jgi:hypothetical protein
MMCSVRVRLFSEVTSFLIWSIYLNLSLNAETVGAYCIIFFYPISAIYLSFDGEAGCWMKLATAGVSI